MENASQALHSLFLMGFKGKIIYLLLGPRLLFISLCFICTDLILVIEISDWQTGAMGFRQPHPSFTAVCGGLLSHSRAPHRKQAAKPNVFPIHPIAEPYSKVIISREDGGGSVFPFLMNLEGEGLQRRLRTYSR